MNELITQQYFHEEIEWQWVEYVIGRCSDDVPIFHNYSHQQNLIFPRRQA